MSRSSFVRRSAPLATGAAVLAGLFAGSGSASAACVDVSNVYPGDLAAPSQIATWMAGGAARAGLPGELPVMAALVESGLTNDPGGDADSVGYFQMRLQYWNQGVYAGYPTNPALQLQWFTDEAQKVEKGRAADETQWGEWIADTERPAAQYRYRYQLQLANARTLIGPGCAAATTPPGQAPGTGALDVTPPTATATVKKRQVVTTSHALYATIVCRGEACTATASAKIAGRELPQAVTLASKPRALKAGQRVKLRVIVGPTIRRAATKAAKRGVPLRAKITVTATDAAGNAAATTLATSLVRR